MLDTVTIEAPFDANNGQNVDPDQPVRKFGPLHSDSAC
jgi:hypothetical protein